MKQAQKTVTVFSASTDGCIKMWSIENDVNNNSVVKHQKTFNGHTNSVNCVLVNKFQNPINEIVTCSGDKTIKVWNIETGKNTHTIQYNQRLWCVAWWKQDQYLIIGVCEGDIHIVQWNKGDSNCERGKIVRTLKGYVSSVSGLIVDRESDQLLSCGWDNAIRLWNLNTGKQIKQFNGHTNCIYGLCKLNKNLFVSASDDASIKFWNMASDECIHTIDALHSDSILTLLYSASEQVLISASLDATVKVWDLKFDNDAIRECTLKFTINNPFDAMYFSSAFLDGENDGTRIIVGDYDGNMFIVDVKSGTFLSQIPKTHLFSVKNFAILHNQENDSMNKKLQKMQQDRKLTNVVIQCK